MSGDQLQGSESAIIKILLADDHKVIIDGLMATIAKHNDMKVVAFAHDGRQVLELLKDQDVDVALLDINMPELNGVEVCKKITKHYPQVKVIALSMYDAQSYVKRMHQYGAQGYLLKDDGADEVVSAIRTVYHGDSYYSPRVSQPDDQLHHIQGSLSQIISERELEVLGLIAEGYTNGEIAEHYFLSPHTVVTHRKTLLRKLSAKNSAELIKNAMEKGLI